MWDSYLIAIGRNANAHLILGHIVRQNLGGTLPAIVCDENALPRIQANAEHILEARTDELRAQILAQPHHGLSRIKAYGEFGVGRQCDAIIVAHRWRCFYLLNDTAIPEIVTAGGTNTRPNNGTLGQTFARRHFVGGFVRI